MGLGKKTVALLMGGTSSEREVSLKSGKAVGAVIDLKKYKVRVYDPQKDLAKLVDEARKIDVALIMLHGRGGEDGQIQGLLELLNIPYQGSGILSSALAMDKISSKHVYQQYLIPTPDFRVVSKKDTLGSFETLLHDFPLPVFVKPAQGGSSVGMSVMRDLALMEKAVFTAFKENDTVLIETLAEGREITVPVLGNPARALPVVEICPNDKHAFFDYEAKYTHGETAEICPAELDDTLTQQAQELAIQAHTALGCRDYSRTDMIMQSNGALTVLETNTLPGMTPASLLPKSAEAAGISMPQLVDELLEMALGRKEKKRKKLFG